MYTRYTKFRLTRWASGEFREDLSGYLESGKPVAITMHGCCRTCGRHIPLLQARAYNRGEAYTPTISERLAWLPQSTIEPDVNSQFDFTQNMAYDTSRIRRELGYREILA